MSELTRRRDTSRNAETWLIILDDIQIGTIGQRVGGHADAEQWGWRCGLSSSRNGARAEGTAMDFDQARSQFEEAWQGAVELHRRGLRRISPCARMDKWKQTMWETVHKLPTQTQQRRTRCFCGAEIDIAGMEAHVSAAHMTETADV
jgi:hypothetical protein